ncbi:glycosyltransferase, group 1 family protein [Fusobacterium sp. CM21]|uniref:glycosyltransferase n=1 Tax=Fusobacterium nucleatum TaxID=851 RepID=UPI0003E1E853|nr:glycosyltransferase [Fusobacterium nucleatum]ETT12283.1 glycosyltransferase, group 1 family protein [Fusobacterium sp. CM21]OHU81702.1 hypothetical protein BKN39_07770 [Fusobacterium nucleatum]
MKKITHIITGLGNGGAEVMLYKLLKYSNRDLYNMKVISLMDKGIIGEKIEELGIPVYTLNEKRGKIGIKSILKIMKICKETDIIETWMYHADFIGFIVAKLLRKKIIWGLHHSNLEKDKNKRLTLMLAKINSKFSSRVDAIISCSEKGKIEHIKFGYNGKKMKVIPNGFELDNFFYINNAKKELEKEFPSIKDKLIFSLVARYDILKDHKNCLEAMSILKEKKMDFVLVLCGTSINDKNKDLMKLVCDNNLFNEVLLLDRRSDIPLIMSATDVYISSSSGEGFPNVIGEAMACETPCVVTDVGDSSYIVGNTGRVVERQNPKKLAEAIEEFIKTKDFIKNRKPCRNRIEKYFEITKIVEEYQKLYEI